ncbi:hypothetical protein [Cytobacillus luteolus]|nr:hypothetical protein [Cytobacillus luteolus]MBP1943321.1 hypothetical protein [Cytobacillus luteolus]
MANTEEIKRRKDRNRVIMYCTFPLIGFALGAIITIVATGL